MERLKWDQSFELGVNIIDKQHKEMFKMLNELVDCYEKHLSYSSKHSDFVILFDNITKILDNYTTLHFEIEEHYSEAYNFPRHSELVKEHQILKEFYSILSYYYHEKQGNIPASLIDSFNNSIYEYFKDHILTLDKELIEFLKKAKIEIKYPWS